MIVTFIFPCGACNTYHWDWIFLHWVYYALTASMLSMLIYMSFPFYFSETLKSKLGKISWCLFSHWFFLSLLPLLCFDIFPWSTLFAFYVSLGPCTLKRNLKGLLSLNLDPFIWAYCANGEWTCRWDINIFFPFSFLRSWFT